MLLEILVSLIVVLILIYFFVLYLQFGKCQASRLKNKCPLPWYISLMPPSAMIDSLAKLNYLATYYSVYYNINILDNLSPLGYKCCPEPRLDSKCNVILSSTTKPICKSMWWSI